MSNSSETYERVRLSHLVCYIARQEARSGKPCVLTSDFRHFGPDADDVRQAAVANGLIRPVSRVKSHKGDGVGLVTDTGRQVTCAVGARIRQGVAAGPAEWAGGGMTPKTRRPSTGKRKPPPVTLARATAWQAPPAASLAPLAGKSRPAATHAAETEDGHSAGEKSGSAEC